MTTKIFTSKRVKTNADLVRVIRHLLNVKSMDIHELKFACSKYCQANLIKSTAFMGVVSQAFSHKLVMLDPKGFYYI